ncbi:MAG: HIT family protein [Gemmatimonadaceae bacterium]
MTCIFCEILGGRSPVSLIYDDETVAAFMGIRPSAPGECLVIPKAHIDHFTDVPDDVSAHIMIVAQHIGRAMRTMFAPERVGFLVHGYGVAHAHLVIVPQRGTYHITSDRFARIEQDRIVFDMKNIPFADRAELDAQAVRLREMMEMIK